MKNLTQMNVPLLDGTQAELLARLLSNDAMVPSQRIALYATLYFRHDMTQQQIADKSGISRPTVGRYLVMGELAPSVLQMIDEGELPVHRGAAQMLVKIKDGGQQLQAAVFLSMAAARNSTSWEQAIAETVSLFMGGDSGHLVKLAPALALKPRAKHLALVLRNSVQSTCMRCDFYSDPIEAICSECPLTTFVGLHSALTSPRKETSTRTLH